MPFFQRSAENIDRKSTRLNSSHLRISYAVFCLKKEEVDRKSTRLNSSHLRISYAAFCLKKKIDDGDHFIVNGSQVLTSHAHHAELSSRLCRTESSRPKHKWLSYLLFFFK